MILWPRLPLPLARILAARLLDSELSDLERAAWSFDPPALFAPTGGIRVALSDMRQLRNDLLSIARENGYPRSLSRSATAVYDRRTMERLFALPMSIGEGLRAETWAWLTVCLAPCLVRWRWPVRKDKLRIDRFAGPLYRNSFGRLWYQASALVRGPESSERWRLASALGADQQVALFERPSLAASPDVCVAIIAGWMCLKEGQRTEEVFRQAMKLLIIRAGIQRMDVLNGDTLQQVVGEAFSTSVSGLDIS